MTTRPILGALSLVLAAGLFVAGCSSLPTTPGGAGLADSTSASPPTATSPVVSASRSVFVRALLGGTVSAGNFRVVIPVGALPGDAIVTVRQPDIDKPVVELSITPEERNHFLLPVLLVADAKPMDSALVSVARLSWWNPDSAQWEACSGSTVDVATLSVEAPLWHFSTYRVEADGKAGW